MILAIVQARMSSSRLPGKVMRPVLGKPLIGHLLERLQRSRQVDRIIVATSTQTADDVLCDFVRGEGFEVFRGPQDDVLARYYQAACRYSPDAIVRITADCPLVDPKIVDEVIDCYLKNNFDYASNIMPRTYPDGMDVEVFSFNALERAFKEAKLPAQREHVTPFIRESGAFRVGALVGALDLSQERWTVDHPEDFVLVKNIIEHFCGRKDYFDMEDIVAYKRDHGDIFAVNRHWVV